MNKLFYYFGIFLKYFSLFKNINSVNGVIVSCTHSTKKENFKNLEEHILKLKKEFDIITPEYFFEYLSGKKNLKKKSLLMTFDDGYKSNYSFAMEVLSKYKIKAIFFIPTKIFDLKSDSDKIKFSYKNINFQSDYKNINYNYEKDFMNLKEIENLSKSGHLIAPHTHSHIKLKKIKDFEEVKSELIEPLKFFIKKFKIKYKVLAFPVGSNGEVSKYSYEMIKKYYDYCFTMLSGINMRESDKFILNRFNFPDNTNYNYLRLNLDGVYDPYFFIKKLLLKFKIS